MELSKGYRTASLGCSYFGWLKPSCHAYWSVLAKNRHLARHCLSGRIAHRNGCHFHYVKSYDSCKGIRLGDICRLSLLNICTGLLILPDFAQVTNFNCWFIPQNYSQVSQIKLFAFYVHSSLHWLNILVWSFDCV
jgi:hypothetical protein